MSGQIPEEFINDLRHRADIVTIIGEFIPLKKRGRNYIGLCPFHSEKTPSFVVSQDKQIYHCFGCGKGGNVFSFLMEKDAMSFPEAVEFLARRCGISIPQAAMTPEKARQDSLKKRYHHINEITAGFFEKLLFESKGREALAYFQSRGLEKETIKKFRLGYAPPDWTELTDYLVGQGFSSKEILTLGLAVKTQKGTLVDRFRHRVMFPITDESGKVIGFGGRVLDDALPKYLNSPDTPLFLKGKYLYGLHSAKSTIRERDQVILMEGYMDTITAHQNGITNSVGTMGTALTPEQARLLMRYTYNTYICFDADSAGQKAALRGLGVLQEQGCNVSVISVPEGKDPDEFIRKEGGAGFTELVERAHTLLEYKLLKLMELHNIQTIPGKIQVVKEIIPDILKTKSPLTRQVSIQLIAEKLMFPENAIHAEIRKAISQEKTPVNTLPKKERLEFAAEKAQKILLNFAMEKPELLDEIAQWGGKDLFNIPVLKEIYQNYYVIRQSGHNIKANDLIALLQDAQSQEILAEILLINEFSEDWERIHKDCLMLLRIEMLKKNINDNNSLMSEYEKKGDVSKALELMAHIQELVKEKHRLNTTLRKGGSIHED